MKSLKKKPIQIYIEPQQDYIFGKPCQKERHLQGSDHTGKSWISF